jgi:hypothetical protein
MPRQLLLSLGAVLLIALALAGPPARVSAETKTYVAPTMILIVDADSVLYLVSKEWFSASVRNQEKLLRHAIRMNYWREHLPADMGMVFDALGYPMSRVLTTPVGHTEEWWYYGTLDPPLRFRDGTLIDVDRFENLLRK